MRAVNTIAIRCKGEREARGWSQSDLADRAGVSQGTIGNLESGLRKRPREIVSIATALGVSPAWLETGKGEKRPQAAPPRAHGGGVTHEIPSIGDGNLIAGHVPMINPTTMQWELILSSELPALFRLVIQDEAMAPEFPRGCVVTFSTTEGEPRPRDAVLVSDNEGGVHFREYEAGRGTRWRAVAMTSGYRPLDSDEDGLRVLAISMGKWGRRG